MGRTTFILNRALPTEKIMTKRWQLNGKDTTKIEIIKFLKKEGYDITEREYVAPTMAKQYKGITIGTSYYGLIIWARNAEDSKKLFDLLIQDGYYDHKCSLPVEIRRDNK